MFWLLAQYDNKVRRNVSQCVPSQEFLRFRFQSSAPSKAALVAPRMSLGHSGGIALEGGGGLLPVVGAVQCHTAEPWSSFGGTGLDWFEFRENISSKSL